MSHHALRWAFDQRTSSPACKLVLIALANRVNDQLHEQSGEARAWPSVVSLAERVPS